MARVSIDVDDVTLMRVMRRYGIDDVRDAVDRALHIAAVAPLSIIEALSLEGSGWDGELEGMRQG